MVDFRITSPKSSGKPVPVQVIMLCKVSSDLPLSPTPFNGQWKHLELADLYFGTHGAIDLFLGTEVFGQDVLNGWWFGHRRLPMALNMILHGCEVALLTLKNSTVQRLDV